MLFAPCLSNLQRLHIPRCRMPFRPGNLLTILSAIRGISGATSATFITFISSVICNLCNFVSLGLIPWPPFGEPHTRKEEARVCLAREISQSTD